MNFDPSRYRSTNVLLADGGGTGTVQYIIINEATIDFVIGKDNISNFKEYNPNEKYMYTIYRGTHATQYIGLLLFSLAGAVYSTWKTYMSIASLGVAAAASPLAAIGILFTLVGGMVSFAAAIIIIIIIITAIVLALIYTFRYGGFMDLKIDLGINDTSLPFIIPISKEMRG